LRLRGDGHLRTLGSHRTLVLGANGLGLRTTVANFRIGNRIRTVLAEELTGVVGEDIGIGQNGFISLVLIRELLKEADGLLETLTCRSE